MIPKFGRTLTDDELQNVNEMIEKENFEFEVRRQSLVKELSYLIHEKELIKEKVEKAERELYRRRNLQEKISAQLYESYLLSIEKSANTIKSVEESVYDLRTLLDGKKAELNKLKGYMKKMKEEFLGIADRYEHFLEKEQS
jgi:predicted nuclease of restriction endonuclease-like (RecB) superfamily